MLDDTNPTTGRAYSGTLTLSGNSYTTTGTDKSIDNESATPITATGDTFNTVLASGATPTQAYAIVDTITDAIENPAFGLVTLQTGNVFVTPNSGSIANAVSAAANGNTLHIEGGSYTGNLDTASKGLTVDIGASPAQVTISGNLALHNGDTLLMEIDGPAPGTGYDQLVVGGTATIDSGVSITPFAWPRLCPAPAACSR